MLHEVQAWLEKHPRFKLHFTLTSASCLTLVECFFTEITAKRIRRRCYSSVDNLEDEIYDYLLKHNAKPKPFTRTRTPQDIIARERRALDAHFPSNWTFSHLRLPVTFYISAC